ncbi:MAG: PAS domain-containing protein [Planctomycetes bacterium]|nr:PAS domain-containing protein [Planctomycetota bacterium]
MNVRPLSERLIGRYLLFGLAGLFCFLALALALAWRGQLTSLVSLTMIVPLTILLLGGLALRQTIRLHSEIEQQLHRLAAAPSTTQIALNPIVASDPIAVGWNQVRERAASQASLANLESRLSESMGGLRQRKLEEVLSSLPDGVSLTDNEGLIQFANRAFAVLLGLPNGVDVSGQRLTDALASAAPHEVDRIREKLNPSAATVAFELPLGKEKSDGVLRIGRSRLVLSSEQTSGWVWTIRDVTQQVLAEDMRDQFVFTVTHELRTPLTNIKAYAETLSMTEDMDVEKQKNFCNIINAEATRLSRLVDELLNVSQMESGALALSRSETDTARLIEEVIMHVQPEIDRKQIDFNASLPAKLPKLHVDKDKIAAALVNLLGNAAKYTPEEGHVELQVQVDDQQIQIHVDDTGIGIGEEELEKVFDKFFRSNDSRVRAITGSGLGLAYAQEVIRLHGGQLSVHSEHNKGSRFTMQLPIE